MSIQPFDSPVDHTDYPKDSHPGPLDDVLSVLEAHNHPFILVELQALRWMGVAANVQYTLDILARTGQLDSLLSGILESDNWQLIKHKTQTCDDRLKFVTRIKRIGQCRFINLWPEDLYCMSVDGDKILIPHCEAALSGVLAEEHFHPDIENRSKGPMVIGDTSYHFLPQYPAQLGDRPLYIPTIPRLLDALMDQFELRIPSGISYAKANIQYLVKYLHLVDQREKLIPLLAARNHPIMENILARYNQSLEEAKSRESLVEKKKDQ